MFNLNQKGVVQLLVPILLLLGIIAGVYLITSGNPLKLFSRATNPPIVFKSSSGASLPLNSAGVPTSTSPTVQIELTSTLGPPVPPSVSGPVPTGTVSYKFAENPTDLDKAPDQSYTKEPTVIDYTFKDASLGSKFIWVEFKDNTGKVDRRSAQIEIVSATPSPTPTPTPSSAQTPPCEIYGDLNLDGQVTKEDAEIVSKIVDGLIVPSTSTSGDTQYMRSVGDVNGDNKITAADALLIDRYVTGLDATFKVCTNAKLSPPNCNNTGDVTTNGNITPLDAYEVTRMVVGYKDSLYTKKAYTDDQKKRADVDGNGNVTITDASRIQRYLLGRDTTFKACPK